jgi:hypothetical protein
MKSAATYGGDPRHHHTDLVELRAENERLRGLLNHMETLLDKAERLCARYSDLLERRSRRVDL